MQKTGIRGLSQETSVMCLRHPAGCRNGGMVDTKDLKSFGPYRLCGFESHFLYEEWLITTLLSVIYIFLCSQGVAKDRINVNTFLHLVVI